MSNTKREILFRGKRVDNGEWVKGAYGNHTSFDAMIMDRPYPTINGDLSALNFWVVDPTTVGQFTGLTDKNGNRIFEGDILKAIWQHLSNTDTVIGIVKYDDADFILETDGHYLFFEDNIFSDECEVVGNIHDNHELLEGSNV